MADDIPKHLFSHIEDAVCDAYDGDPRDENLVTFMDTLRKHLVGSFNVQGKLYHTKEFYDRLGMDYARISEELPNSPAVSNDVAVLLACAFYNTCLHRGDSRNVEVTVKLFSSFAREVYSLEVVNMETFLLTSEMLLHTNSVFFNTELQKPSDPNDLARMCHIEVFLDLTLGHFLLGIDDFLEEEFALTNEMSEWEPYAVQSRLNYFFSLLRRPKILRSPWFEAYEARARDNVEKYITLHSPAISMDMQPKHAYIPKQDLTWG